MVNKFDFYDTVLLHCYSDDGNPVLISGELGQRKGFLYDIQPVDDNYKEAIIIGSNGRCYGIHNIALDEVMMERYFKNEERKPKLIIVNVFSTRMVLIEKRLSGLR